MADSPAFVKTPRSVDVSFVNADGTAIKQVLVMSATGGIIENLFVSSQDTVTRKLTLLRDSQGSVCPVYTFDIPAATASIPYQIVNLLDPAVFRWLRVGDVKWILGGNTRILARLESAVTSPLSITVFCDYGEF